MKTMFLTFLLLILACSDDEENENSDQLQGCQSSALRAQITDAIPATITRISEGDFFYDGNELYLEVNAAEHLEVISNEDGIDTIRIFVPSENLGEVGSTIMIKGSLYICNTEKHGRPTNNLYPFYVLDNFEQVNN